MAVSDAFALSVKVQLFALLPLLLHAPDQIASRLFETRRVMLVPEAKGAAPVVPTRTLSPEGVEETVSPLRPLALRVSCRVVGGTVVVVGGTVVLVVVGETVVLVVVGGATPPPQTLGVPLPPQV